MRYITRKEVSSNGIPKPSPRPTAAWRLLPSGIVLSAPESGFASTLPSAALVDAAPVSPPLSFDVMVAVKVATEVLKSVTGIERALELVIELERVLMWVTVIVEA